MHKCRETTGKIQAPRASESRRGHHRTYQRSLRFRARLDVARVSVERRQGRGIPKALSPLLRVRRQPASSLRARLHTLVEEPGPRRITSHVLAKTRGRLGRARTEGAARSDRSADCHSGVRARPSLAETPEPGAQVEARARTVTNPASSAISLAPLRFRAVVA